MSGAGDGPWTLPPVGRRGAPFSRQASFPGPTGQMLQGLLGEACVNTQVEVRGEDRNTIHGKGDTNYKPGM